MKMLCKRWKTLWKVNVHVEAERIELANEVIGMREMNCCGHLSEGVLQITLCRNDGNTRCGETIRKNGDLISEECGLMSVNQRLKRKLKETMLKTGSCVVSATKYNG